MISDKYQNRSKTKSNKTGKESSQQKMHRRSSGKNKQLCCLEYSLIKFPYLTNLTTTR